MSIDVPVGVVEVDGARFDDVLGWSVEESVYDSVCMARVSLDLAESTPLLEVGASLAIWHGWQSEGVLPLFAGALTAPARWELTELEARDALADRLLRTSLVRSWRLVRPDVVVSDICAAADVPLHAGARAALATLPERLRWVQPRESAFTAIQRLLKSWAADWSLCCDATSVGVWVGSVFDHPRRVERVELDAERIISAELPDDTSTTGKATLLPVVQLRAGVTLVIDGREAVVTRLRTSMDPEPRQEVEWIYVPS